MKNLQVVTLVTWQHLDWSRGQDYHTWTEDPERPAVASVLRRTGDRSGGQWLSGLVKKDKLETVKISQRSLTSQQTDGETMESVTDFIFLGSKITADGDCSHKSKSSLEEKLWHT